MSLSIIQVQKIRKMDSNVFRLSLPWLFAVSLTAMVSLSGANIVQCPTQVCRCDESLHLADCTKTKLTFIPKLPSYVYSVRLDKCSFPNVTKEFFSSLSNNHILSLSMKNCGIKDIDQDAFEDLDYLTNLDLSSNNILAVTLKHSLGKLKNTNLQSLVFNDMGWTDLSLRLFASAPYSINVLSISENPLYLSDGMFDGLEKLSILLVRNSKLRQCPEALKQLNSLRTVTLDLSFNSIALCRTKNLPDTINVLNLTSNHLKSVPNFCSSNRKSNAPKVQTLIFDNNNILKIKKHSFDCLPSLSTLNLARNPLSKIPSKAFNNLPGLESLILNDIKINPFGQNSNSYDIPSLKTFISRGNGFLPYLSKCTQLETIDLSNTDLSIFVSNATEYFGRLPKLKILNLNKVGWKWVPNGFFKLFPNIEYISLSHNGLIEINSSLFLDHLNIKVMSLKSNRITHIGSDTFPLEFWRNIKKLDISENPFTCDCRLLWFRDKFRKSHETFLHSSEKYQCQLPPKLTSLTLSQFNMTADECKPKSALVTFLVATGSIAAVMAISFLIVYKGRWHIRYWVYLLRYRRSDYRRLGNAEFRYDAFVIYSDEDSDFVHRIMLQKIEDEEQFRLCVHFRDFQPGKIIADNIVESMSGSRMAIVVLSKYFCESKWCKFELVIAQDRWLNNESEALLLVMLDDLECKHMTPDLRALMKTTTYVMWTKDSLGQRLFWDQILNTLRRK